jgi:hypothetical protein
MTTTAKGSNTDVKTSQKVAAYITKYKIHDEPVNVDVDELGADWCNRQGSRPNIHICHQVLAPSFKNDGFDPLKPSVGVARNFANNSVLKQKLLDWNIGFSSGDERYPPILKEKMNKAGFSIDVTLMKQCDHLVGRDTIAAQLRRHVV